MSDTSYNRRILLIDDNESIHQDFKKILGAATAGKSDLASAAADIFGDEPVEEAAAGGGFEVDSALQGQKGLELVRKACAEGRPYALAFVDMRMPPGWDGVETIARIWEEYPELEVVICTAYSDYSLDQMIKRLGRTDRMLVLKKPFDSVEVLQLANALTEKWRLSRASRMSIHSLEANVEARTQELEAGQRELVEARKMELVGKLAAGIAHDFNSILTSIIGNAELLAEGTWPEEVRMRAAEIKREAADAGRMTKQLLGFSRRQVRQAERLDLNKLIAAAEPKLRAALGSSVETSLILRAAHPMVEADAAQMEEVLASLAENSREAMPEGGQLLIETADVTKNGKDHVSIAVKDSGAGMSRETQEHIFEPYFTTSADHKGMGLAMCEGVVKQNGGEISFTSETGHGTTFTILLPRAEAQAAVDEAQDADAPTGVVLFVEGDPALRGVASTVLEANGFTVYRAAGGREALAIAGRVDKIDLLLANTVMPEMTGRELAKWLTPLHPDMRTLFSSTTGEGDCLKMPYTPSTLVTRTRAAIAA